MNSSIGRPTKRARSESNVGCTSKLMEFLGKSQFAQAYERARKFPKEVAEMFLNDSPLALACRNGAPLQLVQLLLVGDPSLLRSNLGSRGTPLHEAIVCERAGPNIIRALLQADEALGTETTRATLLQDVDGFTPLHLLIRRRFQSHILNTSDSGFMAILEALVCSCPESVTVPDQGEYEEPPIVYALKANIYSPGLRSDDAVVVQVERQIYAMVEIMLRYAPMAAAKVFSGFRGDYSALHSAVFHGRYTTTVNLLLSTGQRFPSLPSVAMHTNTQRELPLHFCAMRGERPSTVAALARSAPKAVSARDASGLTPFHWLWIRFISTMLSLEDDGRAGEEIAFAPGQPTYPTTKRYSLDSSSRSSGGFLRMRHIPSEVASTPSGLEQAEKVIRVLQGIRDRHRQGLDIPGGPAWNRLEAICGLFWTKVVSLLEAVQNEQESYLVHTCFSSSSCPPPVANIVATLFPEELTLLDGNNRLPIHIAANRNFHSWDWTPSGSHNGPATQLLQQESFWALKLARDLSPRETLRVADCNNQLVLHIVISNYVRQAMALLSNSTGEPVTEIISMLRELISRYPESLVRRDGVTKLPPFMQTIALTTEENTSGNVDYERFSLNLSYSLLRENPTALLSYHHQTQ